MTSVATNKSIHARSSHMTDYLSPTVNSVPNINPNCMFHNQSAQYICTFQTCDVRLLCTECYNCHPESHKPSVNTYKEILGPNILMEIDEEIYINLLQEQRNEAFCNFINQIQICFDQIRRRVDKTLEELGAKIKEKVMGRVFVPQFSTMGWDKYKSSLLEKKNMILKVRPEEQAKYLDEYLELFYEANTAISDACSTRGITRRQDKETLQPPCVDQESMDNLVNNIRKTLTLFHANLCDQLSSSHSPSENMERTNMLNRPYKNSEAAFHLSNFHTKPVKTLNNSLRASSNTSLGGTNKDKAHERTNSSKMFTDYPLLKPLETEEMLERQIAPFVYDEYISTEILELPHVGPIKMEDGSIYKGQMKDGKSHGKGKQTWKDGRSYEGYYSSGVIQGKGRMIHNDQDIYEGEWLDGLAHGKGKYRRADGWTYEGQWAQDQPHGKGVEMWIDSTKYDGEYNKGQKEGKGTLKCADGASYKGEFKDNMFHGEGVYTWTDGRKYEGTWEKNMREGRGVMTWLDGRRYGGEFSADKRTGFGTYDWGDGRKYTGYWKDGKPDGQGKLQNANGEILEGDWKEGKLGRSGQYVAISIKDLRTFRDSILNKSADLSDYSRQSVEKATLRTLDSPGGANNYSVKSVTTTFDFEKRKETTKKNNRPDLKIVIKQAEPAREVRTLIEKKKTDGKSNNINNVGVTPSFSVAGTNKEDPKNGGYKIQIYGK